MKIFEHFIPHERNNHKSHLIKPPLLFTYTVIILLLTYSFNFLGIIRPGILGIASDISVTDIVKYTNEQRGKNGASSLTENPSLSEAAVAKANDMFSTNYWAHISPAGKTPWEFIRAYGYSYSAAGENLARDFDRSQQVVEAWMNSPSHRENLLSTKFTEIGVGVVNGTLEGKETTLVVQMFGKPVGTPVIAKSQEIVPEPTSKVPVPQASTPSEAKNQEPVKNPQPIVEFTPQPAPVLANPQVANSQIVDVEKLAQKGEVLNKFEFQKKITLTLISILCIVLLLDFIVARKKGLVRQTGLSLGHFGILILLFVGIWYTNSGLIL